MPTLPTATSTFSGIQTWAQPMFDGLLPYGYLAAGIILGVGLISFIIYIATHASNSMKGH